MTAAGVIDLQGAARFRSGRSGLPDELLVALESVLASVATAVVDGDGLVRLWSRGAETLTGKPAAHVAGRPYEQLWSESREGPLHHTATRTFSRGDDELVALRAVRVEAGDAGFAEVLFAAEGEPSLAEQMLVYAADLGAAHRVQRDLVQRLKDAEAEIERLQQGAADVREAPRESAVLREAADDGAALRPGGVRTFHGLLSGDPAMHRVFDTVLRVASSSATVLVRGESGTGKELIALAVHRESKRKARPFVAINCAALPVGLAESVMFGHVRGAFTGAHSSHDGIFVQADGGTLFLDEVAELPLELQSKLLRALQERVVTPVGSTVAVPVDVRIVAASHRSLRDEVAAGRFREDLMYRLQVVSVDVPPLRKRGGDVEILVRHFLARLNERYEERAARITPAAVRALLSHAWPGNVRELENAIEHGFALGRGGVIGVFDLPATLRAPAPQAHAGTDELDAVTAARGGRSPRDARSAADEKRLMEEALRRADGKLNDAARLLGMSRATFYRKRQKHGLG